jgi:ATP-dependent helicase HrpA
VLLHEVAGALDDALHARFADEHSDFIAYLNLWRYLRNQRKELSGSAFRRICRKEFLHYLRIREWQDLVGQLRSIARDLGIVESDRQKDEAADRGQVHAALLAGLLSHVGMRREDTREYLGARNARFVLAPGSVLTKRPPQWVVAAELVETSRLYGRTAARVQPEIVERVAGELVQRTYSEPHWDAQRGEVLAYERVTLYGLPLIARRRVGYAKVEPPVARELFIRHALVEGDWQTRHHFFRDNARLRAELEELEERARRRDLLVGDDDLFALYDARIPADVVSARHFDAWWKKQRHRTPELLTFTRDDLLRTDETTAGEDRPDTWRTGDAALALTYRFEPGAPDDGVTVHVPIDVLARLGGDEFVWQVPALREELVTALIRSLPKDLRRNFVPAPDTARAVLSGVDPAGEPLLTALQRELRRRTGVVVPVEAFDLDKLPPHLRVTFAVESTNGTEVARGKDLHALQQRLAVPARQAVAHAVAGELERTGLRSWPEGLAELPRLVERVVDGRSVRGFPAFADAGAAVDLRVFTRPEEQGSAMGPGLRRLVRLSVPSPVKAVERQIDPRTRLILGTNPDGSLAALLDDCADAATDALTPQAVWTHDAFSTLRDRVAARLVPTTIDLVGRVAKVLSAAQEVQLIMPTAPPAPQAEAISDMRAQLNRLLPPGFVTATGAAHLDDLARYLTAIKRRLEKLPQAIQGDRERMRRVQGVQDAFDQLLHTLPPDRRTAADIRDIGRQIEELRVSLWAQQLGTPRPVSEQRIYRAIDAAHDRP